MSLIAAAHNAADTLMPVAAPFPSLGAAAVSPAPAAASSAAASSAAAADASGAAASRAALLADLFADKPMPRAFGHEVRARLLLANVHALRDADWLARVRADVVVVCAAELAAELPALRARAPPLLDVIFEPMEEADARCAGAGAVAGSDDPAASELLPLGVTRAYAGALRAQLERAADAAHAAHAQGRVVVVACKYGCNRSASTLLALLARHHGVPMAEGLAQLRAARPRVYPNIETWPSLLAIEAAALGRASLTEEELLAHHGWSPRNMRGGGGASS